MGRLSVKYQIDPSKAQTPRGANRRKLDASFSSRRFSRGLFWKTLNYFQLYIIWKLGTHSATPGLRCTDRGNFRQVWNFPGPAVIWVIFGNQSNYFWTWWPKIDEIAPKYKGSPSPPQNKANRRWGSEGMFKPLFELHNDQVPRFVGSPSKEMLKEKSIIRDEKGRQWIDGNSGFGKYTRQHLFNWRPLSPYQDQSGHVSTA